MDAACQPPRVDGFCSCGEPLPRRKDGLISPRRRWCSTPCATRVVTEHLWTAARRAALRRAGIKYITLSNGRRKSAGYPCARCPVRTRSPEVNHIQPLRGGVRTWSCLNHADNLEVLCHSCHVHVTNGQRK